MGSAWAGSSSSCSSCLAAAAPGAWSRPGSPRRARSAAGSARSAARGCRRRCAPRSRAAFLELALPVEDAGLGSDSLGLGNHAGGLVDARERRVRECLLGGELDELLRRLDRALVPPELACG